MWPGCVSNTWPLSGAKRQGMADRVTVHNINAGSFIFGSSERNIVRAFLETLVGSTLLKRKDRIDKALHHVSWQCSLIFSSTYWWLYDALQGCFAFASQDKILVPLANWLMPWLKDVGGNIACRCKMKLMIMTSMMWTFVQWTCGQFRNLDRPRAGNSYLVRLCRCRLATVHQTNEKRSDRVHSRLHTPWSSSPLYMWNQVARISGNWELGSKYTGAGRSGCISYYMLDGEPSCSF